MTFEEWLEFYSPGADKVFTTGEIIPLRHAWNAATEEAAQVADTYRGVQDCANEIAAAIRSRCE